MSHLVYTHDSMIKRALNAWKERIIQKEIIRFYYYAIGTMLALHKFLLNSQNNTGCRFFSLLFYI